MRSPARCAFSRSTPANRQHCGNWGLTIDARAAFSVLRAAATTFRRHDAPRLAAALAFYSAFSLAPILIIAIAISGAIFGAAGARGEIFGQLEGVLGISGASAVQAMVISASKPASGIVATAVSAVFLALGATAVFGELQSSFNVLWRGEAIAPRRGVKVFMRERIFSFGIVAAVAFLLVVSLLANAVLAGVEKYTAHVLPAAAPLLNAGAIIISTGLLTALFGLIYAFVPVRALPHRAAWLGAVATAVLFELGETIIALYLGRTAVASTYGAAGSLLIVLLWVFYSAQVTLFGACLAGAIADSSGPGQRSPTLG